MPRHATKTSFKKGHTPANKGKKGSRPDLSERNKSVEQRNAVSIANRGRVKDDEWKKKLSDGVKKAYEECRLVAKSGEDHYMYGKTTSDKQKEIAREQMKAYQTDEEFQRKRKEGLVDWQEINKDMMTERMKKMNSDTEFNRKRLKALCKKPTMPEQIIIDLIHKYNLPYKYVGNGSLIIDGLNPDFINTKGQKKIIEVFGRFWHETYYNVDWKRTEIGRTETFDRLGYKMLIIWDDEMNSTQSILDRISIFDGE